MSFADQPTSVRFMAMGDEAEGVFENAKPLGNAVRFGWRKPKGISISNMPPHLRHTPDYMTESGYFVEVVGLGRDGILKGVKPEKYEALKVWNRISKMLGGKGVLLFCWNSSWRTYAIMDMNTVKGLVQRAKNRGVETFQDGGEYYPIEWRWIVEKAVILEKWDG